MESKQILNFPNDLSSENRRRFLKGMLGGAAAGILWPGCDLGQRVQKEETAQDPPLPLLEETDPGDEAFWETVRAQYPLREGLIMLNAANLCPSPLSVQKRVFDLTADVDADPSFTNRAKFPSHKEESRAALAEFIGAGPDEIAIVRNTSEGNNVVISGLNLGEGDEVVIWDQNHPTANIAWDVRAERYGYSVKRITTPENPQSPEELLRVFTNAFSTKTKILCFSHVSNVSGVRLPARELCSAARSAGILTLVDGAQTLGTFLLNLREMGCDFFTGSSHKWFCGPKEVGILYVRKDRCKNLHPLVVGVGWETAQSSGARRFETLGQQDDSRVAAMKEAVAFQTRIGLLRISSRAQMIADAVKDGLKTNIPGAKLITPIPHQMSWGVVVFKVPGLDIKTALDTLYREHSVGCAVMGENLRYSPHIYNTLEDIDKAIFAVKKML